MKYEWMREKETLIPCKIVHRGVIRELALHHLTAADVDEADRKYPALKDAEPQAAEEQAMNRASYLAVLALGPEAFETRDIDAQMQELRRSGDGFSRIAIIQIAAAAYRDSMLTPEMLEAAKKSIAPFESAE